MTGVRCLVIFGLVAGCGAPQESTRSPSHDYPPPGPTSSDGEALGADGVPPAQKLEEGPKLDPDRGVVPAGSPSDPK